MAYSQQIITNFYTIIMKHLILSLLILLPFVTNAQKDVTKFLGIPIDGTKSEMIQKLKAKGFKSSYYDKEILEGEFNGAEATIMIQTNNNKVWRIIVSYSNLSEQNAKTRFNNLCYQFQNNSKYYSAGADYTIPDSDDISYEMSVNEKRYEGLYIQCSERNLNIATDDYSKHLFDNNYDANKIVWFALLQYNPMEYSIAIYYENGYNQANGEDL